MAKKKLEIEQKKFFAVIFRIVRISLRVLFFFCLLIYLVVFTFPWLISTSWGRWGFFSILQLSTSAKIDAEDIHLSWTGGQEIDHFRWENQEKGVSISFERFVTDASLKDILFRRASSGSTILTSPEIVFHASSSEQSGLKRKNIPSRKDKISVQKIEKQRVEKKKKDFAFFLPMTGNFLIEKGKFTYVREQELDLLFNEMEIKLSAPPAKERLSCYLQGKTCQGEISGNLRGEFLIDGFSPDGVFRLIEKEEGFYPSKGSKCTGHLEINQLPVKGIGMLLDSQARVLRPSLDSLIGEKIDIFSQIHSDTEKWVSTIKLFSPQLQSVLQGEWKEGLFMVEKGDVDLIIHPEKAQEVFASYSSGMESRWNLESPFEAHFSIDRCIVPFSLYTLHGWKNSLTDFIRAASFGASFSLSPLQFEQRKEKQKMRFSSVEASLSTYPGEENCTLFARSELKWNRAPASTLVFQGSFSHFFDDKNQFSPYHSRGNFSSYLSKFPLACIDEIINTDPWLQGGLGKTCTVHLSGSCENGEGDLKHSLQTEYLQAQEMHLSIENGWKKCTLKDPFMITYRLPHKVVNYGLKNGLFFGDTMGQKNGWDQMRLKKDLQFYWKIDSFSMPLNWQGNDLFSSHDLLLDTEFSSNAIDVHHIPEVKDLLWNDFKIKVRADSLQDIQFETKGELWGKEGQLIEWMLGRKSTFSLEGQAFLDREGTIAIPRLNVQIDSERLHGKGTVQSLYGKHVTLVSPLTIDYILLPQFVSYLFPQKKERISLVNEVPIYWKITEGQIPLFFKEDSAYKGKIEGKIGDMLFHMQDSAIPEPSVKETYFQTIIDADEKQQSADLTLRSHLFSSSTQHAGFFETKANVYDWHSHYCPQNSASFGKSGMQAEFSSVLDQISVPMVEAFMQKSEKIAPLIGSVLRIESSGKWKEEQKSEDSRQKECESSLDFRIAAVTDHLKMEGNYHINQKKELSSIQPTVVDWIMTPSAFSRLLLLTDQPELQKLEISQPTSFQFSLDRLSIPLDQIFYGIPQGISFQFNFYNKEMTVSDRRSDSTFQFAESEKQISVDDLFCGTVSGRGKTRFFHWDQGEKIAKEGRGSGHFTVKNCLFPLMGWTQIDSSHKPSLNWGLSIHGLPVSWMAKMVFSEKNTDQENRTEKQYEAVLGKELFVETMGDLQEMEGDASLKLRGEYCDAVIDGFVSEKNLHLKEPMQVNLRVNSLWNDAIFNGAVQLQNSSIPVSLKVGVENTSVPLFPFSIEHLSLGTSTLDLNRWSFYSQNKKKNFVQQLLHDLLFEFFKEKSGSLIDCWFAPMDFSIDHGILRLHRADALLLQKMHLIAWGESLLQKEKLHFNIGITTDSFSRFFPFDNILSAKGILHIPVKGSWSHPDIQWKALANILGVAKGKERVIQSDITKDNINALFGFAFDSIMEKKIEKHLLKEEEMPFAAHPQPWKPSDIAQPISDASGSKDPFPSDKDQDSEEKKEIPLQEIFSIFSKKK